MQSRLPRACSGRAGKVRFSFDRAAHALSQALFRRTPPGTEAPSFFGNSVVHARFRNGPASTPIAFLFSRI
jgi:hypothetical protein